MNATKGIEKVRKSQGGDKLAEIVTWSVCNAVVPAAKLNALAVKAGQAERKRTWSSVTAYAVQAYFDEQVKALGDKAPEFDASVLRGESDDSREVWQVNSVRETKIDGVEKATEQDYACFLEFNLDTGAVTSKKKPDMAARIQKIAAVEYETRRTHDVTFVLDSIFRKAKVDLIPLRDQGGAYVVFAEYAAAIDTAQEFLNGVAAAMGKTVGDADSGCECKFVRLCISDQNGNQQAIGETWTAYVDNLIVEFRDKVDGFDTDSRGKTLEATAEAIRGLRTKIEAHAGVMADDAKRVHAALDACTKSLVAKIQAAQAREKAEPKARPAPKIAKAGGKSKGKSKAA